MIEKNIKNFIIEQENITIPEVQKKFNIDYIQANKIFKELQEEGIISIDSGLNFVINIDNLKNNKKPIKKRKNKQPNDNKLFKLLFGDTNDNYNVDNYDNKYDDLSILEDDNLKVDDEYIEYLNKAYTKQKLKLFYNFICVLKDCIESKFCSKDILLCETDLSIDEIEQFMEWLLNNKFIDKEGNILISNKKFVKIFGMIL